MKIKRIHVQNYMGFKDSGWIDLSPDFNVLVGPNNSGKTAFLQALSLTRLAANPFRSAEASDVHEINPASLVEYEIEVSWKEWVEALAVRGGEVMIQSLSNIHRPADEELDLLRDALKSHSYEILFSTASGIASRKRSSHGLNQTDRALVIRPTDDRQDIMLAGEQSNSSDTLLQLLPTLEARHILHMSAQRTCAQPSAYNASRSLGSNAQNLAAVLNNMSSQSPALFEKLKSHMRELFPDIVNITIAPTSDGSQAEIRLWFSEAQTKLSQSVSLQESGTGVSQALAILYFAVAENSSIIIIDEINSFLHPFSLKRLLNILSEEYTHHQYIVSTHSTDVISWSKSQHVLTARKSEGRISLEMIPKGDLASLRRVADELGVSMADVFASDHIIWVEGETEEIAFPLIMRAVGKPLPPSVSLTAVISTGDLSGSARGAELAYRIYERLSFLAAPLVKSAVFSFDREGMTPQQMSGLRRKAGTADVRILPRRSIENYVLHAGAVASLLQHWGESAITAERVQEWLIANGSSTKYKASSQWNGDSNDEKWLRDVDAAKLLSNLIQDLTESRQQLTKVTDVPWLLDWLLAHDREHIAELCRYILALIPAGSGQTNT